MQPGSWRLALIVLAPLAFTAPCKSVAQNMTVEAIEAAVPVDVPLVIGAVDTSAAGRHLWVKGDQPANSLLAQITVKPIQSAKMIRDGAEIILWRAIPTGLLPILKANELDLAGQQRIFCAKLSERAGPDCYVDVDGDGRFEQAAEPITERGVNPYHVTILRRMRPLATPLSYHLLADEQRPALTIKLRNCAKDHDRPRFTALSTSDRNISMPIVGWHAKDSSLASCRRGRQRSPAAGASAGIPTGGYLAEIGPLVFTVGAKRNPQLALIGPVDPDALYRIEGGSLIELSVGRTPAQAQLIALKKFPYPALMTDAGAIIEQGSIAVGGRLATLPFHHGYRGMLTQDIVISTLFGKRSLAAGTILYGFPAQSRLTRTVNGMPDIDPIDDDSYRTIRLELTWCAPVKGPLPERQKTGAIDRGGWSAACIPYSSLGNYTILTDRSPAFAVTGVSYDATTSSNDGQPPVRRDDSATFQDRLRVDYVYKGRDGDFITLAEEIHSGNELTSSKPVKLYAPSGKVDAMVAGVAVALDASTQGALTIRATGAPVIGMTPILQWDGRALMIKQLAEMGLRSADE